MSPASRLLPVAARRHRLPPGPAVAWLAALAGAAAAAAAIDDAQLQAMRLLHEDATELLADHYHPNERADPRFRERMRAVDQELASTRSLSDACLLLADAYRAFDPGIRLYVFPRHGRVDYGWSWRLIGDEAFVCQVDPRSEAARHLKLGDQVLTLEGQPVNRSTYRLLSYVLQVVAPRPQVRVQVRGGDGEVRSPVVPVRIRDERRTRNQVWSEGGYDVVLGAGEGRRLDDYRNPARQVQRVGRTLVWRAAALTQRLGDISDILRQAGASSNLVIDLRGLQVFRHDTVAALLDGLLKEKAVLARIEKKGRDEVLAASGNQRFSGGVAAVVDSTTAGYAELLAAVLQRTGRGLVIGDQTMGQVREEGLAARIRVRQPAITRTVQSTTTGPNGQPVVITHQVVDPGRTDVLDAVADLSEVVFDPSRWYYGVRFPLGIVRLADGTDLHGHGVQPDTAVRPTAKDLAARRDVALAAAIQLTGERMTPEAAYGLFRNDWDDDEFILDLSGWY